MSAPLAQTASALRHFPLPARAPTWFPGHMVRSLREFGPLLRDIDIVIEARDARLPLTGVNVALEGVVRRSWGLPAGQTQIKSVGLGDSDIDRDGPKVSGSFTSAEEGTEGGVSEAEAGPSRTQLYSRTADKPQLGPAGGEVMPRDLLPPSRARSNVNDRKGKGRAVSAWTDDERMARLEQIQRQGGRMRERVVVYTKRDLAEERFEEPLREAFWEHARQRVFFANTQVDRDVKHVMRHIVDLAKQHAKVTGNEETRVNVLVVGMPNVGKSSLLNALRRAGVKKGKAFRTSAKPGLTRKLTGTVRINEDPPIYVYDAPGVMVPFLGRGEEGVEKGLKLALTSGIKEGIVPEEINAEYLLHLLNTYQYPDIFLSRASTPGTAHTSTDAAAEAGQVGVAASPGTPESSLSSSTASAASVTITPPADPHTPPSPPVTTPAPRAARADTYLHRLALSHLTPTDSLHTFLSALAKRLGALRRGGEVDVEHAQTFFLRMFREGKLGRVTIDDLGRVVDPVEDSLRQGEVNAARFEVMTESVRGSGPSSGPSAGGAFEVVDSASSLSEFHNGRSGPPLIEDAEVAAVQQSTAAPPASLDSASTSGESFPALPITATSAVGPQSDASLPATSSESASPSFSTPIPTPDERVRLAVRTFLAAQSAALENYMAALESDDNADNPLLSDTQRRKRGIARRKAYKAERDDRRVSAAGGGGRAGPKFGSGPAGKGKRR